MRYRFWIITFTAVALVACEATSPLQETQAVAMFRCGPADQGGTAILLTPDPISPLYPPASRVEVTILASVTTLAGRTWNMNTDTAGAWNIVGGDGLESATSGHITVASVDAARTVTGSVELHFPSTTVATDFTAPWVENGVTCP